jgi:excisionase family DNA binding protein
VTPARETPQRILLTVREVAFVLGCGRTLVYDLIGSRQLPIVKVGRLTRVPMAAVDNFVSRHLMTGSSIAVQTPTSPPSRRRTRPRAVVSLDTAQTTLFDDRRVGR